MMDLVAYCPINLEYGGRNGDRVRWTHDGFYLLYKAVDLPICQNVTL